MHVELQSEVRTYYRPALPGTSARPPDRGMIDVAVVLNRGAGADTTGADGNRIATLFADRGREATIFPVRPGSSIAREVQAVLDGGCRVLAAGGGDGTVSAAAGVLVGGDVPMGVLPLGTLNHFAKDLGLPLGLEDAVAVVAQGAARRVDVGEVNGRIFLNNASLGVYPRIVELRGRYAGRGRAKWLAALWAALTVLRRRPFLDVRIRAEDEVIVRRTPFVFVGNNEYRMAGVHGASRESLTGAELALYVMDAAHRPSLVRLGWEVFWHGPERVRELDLLRVAEAVVETPRRDLRIALDGEVVVLASPLEFRSRPGALRVVAP
jgi:diacylglycerol kinase family enzyme